MKKALMILLAGAVLLGTSPLFAQAYPNGMGLAAESSYFDYCVYGPGMQVYIVYVFIDNPVNPDFDGGGSNPVSWINGFEGRFVAEGDATLLGMHFPVNAIDAGTNGNTVVGFAEPVPVVDGRAIVATLEIFLQSPVGGPDEVKRSPQPCDAATGFVYIFPTRPTSSIEGKLAYLDADDPDDPLVAAQVWLGWEDGLALVLEVVPVATEQQTWGTIKTLYR